MNRILFKEQSNRYLLDPRDPRFEHVRGVLRMGIGDRFDVGIINGPVGKAEISSLDREELEISVEWGSRPPLPPPVILMVGMCRPATARKILLTAPTLGVLELIFMDTDRSDPAYRKASLWKDNEWQSRLIEGTEQAFDTYVPPLHLENSLEEAILRLPEGSLKLALDVYEGAGRLSAVELSFQDPVYLAVGPERGWSNKDRNLLRDKGFRLVSLNERVLKVETAVTVGLTLLLSGMGVY